MRALVVYESMFGNTRQVAEAIAEGTGFGDDVVVVRADSAPDAHDSDLVVVGCPTHAWSMPRPATRRGAPGYVTKSGGALRLEPGADTVPGIREWLASLEEVHALAAAFDTRFRGHVALTGSASRGIHRRLRRLGCLVVPKRESFVVDKQHRLVDGELARARAWGASLAAAASQRRASLH